MFLQFFAVIELYNRFIVDLSVPMKIFLICSFLHKLAARPLLPAATPKGVWQQRQHFVLLRQHCGSALAAVAAANNYVFALFCTLGLLGSVIIPAALCNNKPLLIKEFSAFDTDVLR